MYTINFADLEKIESIKKKRLYAAQLLKDFMEDPYDSYWGGGDKAAINTEHEEEIADIMKTQGRFIRGLIQYLISYVFLNFNLVLYVLKFSI
jgi:hypothetical protein